MVQLKKKTPLKNITFKGAKYELVSGEHAEIIPQVEDFLPSPVEESIYVRMSMTDFDLLSSLPEATYGPVKNLLQRARQKKLEGGRAEVNATETEVADVISALEDFIDEEEGAPASIAHAQDMLSAWKRNYLLPDRPLSKPMPSYKSELPRSTNVRMFSYKGAKYVLVEGARELKPEGVEDVGEEEDPEEKSPTERFLEEMDNEQFAEYFGNIPKAVYLNSPLFQTKTNIDRLEQATAQLHRVTNKEGGLNWKQDGMRMLTDALFKTEQNMENLVRLTTEEGLVDQIIQNYVENLSRYKAAIAAAEMAHKRALDHAVKRGWTSAWKSKKQAAQLKKQLLRELYGITDPKGFVKDYYKIPEKSASVTHVPHMITFKGRSYTRCG